MPSKLTQVDELAVGDHYYLEPDDRCYFLREYTAGGGWQASETNQLIFNLKKDMARRGNQDWRYKGLAIGQCARELQTAFGRNLDQWVIVPVPPSAARTEPEYDDRMLQVATKMCLGSTATVRELVVQVTSTLASHLVDPDEMKRPTPTQIAKRYAIDHSVCTPVPVGIIVLDDVLTTGSHFKAMQVVLSARFPGMEIIGVFIARRRPADDEQDDEPQDDDE
jgi:predicted secreted protein